MNSFCRYFYNFVFLPAIKNLLYLYGFFNVKVKEGISGRKKLFDELNEKLDIINRNKKTFWFHSSSMGEFEQAKPVIEKLKQTGNVNIVVTFFSPSGYKNSLNYSFADIISYVPFDEKKDVTKFIDLIEPDTVVFMRYDYWPNTLWLLGERNIPVFIVDATMPPNSKRKLLCLKSFHEKMFENVNMILTVSDEDKNSFADFGIPKQKLITVGDTRYDRVYQKSTEAKSKQLIKPEILANKKVLVLGSTWEEDEKVILPAVEKLMNENPEVLVIIAPHEPSQKRIDDLQKYFGKEITTKYSQINNYSDEKIILIDSIGILLTLYHYADIAYVGGSFKQGIHNVLEPAVYGIPVVFGPKNKNSQEAQKMIAEGCGLVVNNEAEAYKVFNDLLSNDEKRKSLGNISAEFVMENTGATEKIIECLNNV